MANTCYNSEKRLQKVRIVDNSPKVAQPISGNDDSWAPNSD